MVRRSRAWCYTLNNYTEEEEKYLREVDAQYHVFGKEVGEQGTPHLQGFIYFKGQKSLSAVSKIVKRAHLEAARNNQASIEYCKKDGRVYEKGDPPIGAVGKKCTMEERMARNKRLRESTLTELVETGEISIMDVRKLKNARLDLLQEGKAIEGETVRGVWYWGEPGTGKSHKARTENPGLYLKSQNKWFDGYQGEEVILLDDFDCRELGHHLKIWADKWSCTGEVKGGMVNLKHKSFIVTSNYHPDTLWEDINMREAIKRRFKITHFNKL